MIKASASYPKHVIKKNCANDSVWAVSPLTFVSYLCKSRLVCPLFVNAVTKIIKIYLSGELIELQVFYCMADWNYI